MPFDREVAKHLRRQIRDGGEYGRRLRGTRGIVGAVEQVALVQLDAAVAHLIDERRIQMHPAGEPDGRPRGHRIATAFDVHRVQQHRHLPARPRGDAHHQRQFRHAADAALRRTVVQHPFDAAARGTQHPVIPEQRIQRNLAAGEQFGDAGRMRVGQVETGGKLFDVLQRRRRQRFPEALPPETQPLHTGTGLRLILTHRFTHFPTALRYS